MIHLLNLKLSTLIGRPTRLKNSLDKRAFFVAAGSIFSSRVTQRINSAANHFPEEYKVFVNIKFGGHFLKIIAKNELGSFQTHPKLMVSIL